MVKLTKDEKEGVEWAFSDNLENPYQCLLCVHQNKTWDKMRDHLRIHFAAKRYQCSSCEYRTNTANNLKLHLISHSKKKYYGCGYCKFATARSFSMKRHLQRCSFSITKENVLVRCLSCPFQSENWEETKNHVKTHLQIFEMSCAECDYQTTDFKQFKQHLFFHQCPQYILEKNSEDLIQNFIEINFTKTELGFYQCPLCSIRMADSKALFQHYQTHGEASDFVCKDCSFQTNRYLDYKNHRLSHQAKIYICEHCSYRTDNLSNLKRHKYRRHLALTKTESKWTNYQYDFELPGFSKDPIILEGISPNVQKPQEELLMGQNSLDQKLDCQFLFLEN